MKPTLLAIRLPAQWQTRHPTDSRPSIKATPDEVHRRIVRNVGDWWDPAHTFSGDAYNLGMLNGGLGPLQSMATTGSLTITFAAVNVSYAVGGYLAGGLNTLEFD